MNVITTFAEKKREKQIKFERSVLREISVKKLKEHVHQSFSSSPFIQHLLNNEGIEEACYDVAIEAYLLGAYFSRFGQYGESLESIKGRCRSEEQHFVNTLYHFFLYWGHGEEAIMDESLLYLCEQYVAYWWREGFHNGERRYKLKLH